MTEVQSTGSSRGTTALTRSCSPCCSWEGRSAARSCLICLRTRPHARGPLARDASACRPDPALPGGWCRPGIYPRCARRRERAGRAYVGVSRVCKTRRRQARAQARRSSHRQAKQRADLTAGACGGRGCCRPVDLSTLRRGAAVGCQRRGRVLLAPAGRAAELLHLGGVDMPDALDLPRLDFVVADRLADSPSGKTSFCDDGVDASQPCSLRPLIAGDDARR